MFYISSFSNGLYGVMDTADGVEELYTKSKIIRIVEKGVKIEGVEYLSWCDKWQFEVYSKLSKVYKLIAVKDNIFKLEQFTKLQGFLTKRIKDNIVSDVSLEAVVGLVNSGVEVDGFQSYLDSRLNKGDKVIYGLSKGKPFLLNFKLFDPEKDRVSLRDMVNRLKGYNYNYFSSEEDALRYIGEYKLTIVNDFFSDIKDSCGSYFNSKDDFVIETFIMQSGKYIPLYRCIPMDFLCTLEGIIYSLTGKEYCFGESGNGYYNPRGNCFHFTTNKTLSFELGTSEPESKLLIDGGYDWKADLKKWGVCIVRASLHASKTYSSDIQFYQG